MNDQATSSTSLEKSYLSTESEQQQQFLNPRILTNDATQEDTSTNTNVNLANTLPSGKSIYGDFLHTGNASAEPDANSSKARQSGAVNACDRCRKLKTKCMVDGERRDGERHTEETVCFRCQQAEEP